MPRIIVGIDGSDHATDALKWAIARAARDDKRVLAVMVWNTFDQGHHQPGENLKLEFDDADAQAFLAGVIESAGVDTSLVDTRTVHGVAAETLVELARPDDLIVVGARGLGGFKGLLLGSVSSRVLELATSPVAVFRGVNTTPSTGEVVVGVDGSDKAETALAWAAGEARAAGVGLRIVWAWQAPLHPEMIVPEVLQALEGEVRKDLEVLAADDRLTSIGASGLTVTTETPCTTPAAALLAHGDASMIVVGSRGRGVVARLVLGSVSRQVAQHAEIPVVIV